MKGIVGSCSQMFTESYTRAYRKFINRLDGQFPNWQIERKLKKKIRKEENKGKKPQQAPNKIHFKKIIPTG